MPPNGFVEGVKPCPKNTERTESGLDDKSSSESVPEPYKPVLIWTNIISIILLHVAAVFSFVRWSLETSLYTYLWGFFVGTLGAFGVTAGAHRLWTHKSYKAKWPLRVILILCYSIAGQNSLYDWVRDHRVHHKFSETDADPHNSNRGFFFAHVGWLMQKKHPEVLRRGRLVKMSDLLEDPIVAFHQRYFTVFKIVLCFVIPVFVPYHFWNESFVISLMGIGCVRYVLGLNFTWLVNSAAHLWGNRPYDNFGYRGTPVTVYARDTEGSDRAQLMVFHFARISPAENLAVAIVAFGEGWHNYHHVFPWDYKAAELGDYRFNFTTFGLDMFEKIGWAYDMKQPSKELIQKVCTKYGDGSHPDCPSPHEVDECGQVTNCCQTTSKRRLRHPLKRF